jgi:[ribosomal protein S18]-alanine N-acetyltransferase
MIMQSNQYSINAMTESDLSSIMAIEKESFDYPWKNKKSFLHYSDNRTVYTLRSDNSIAGYILIDIIQSDMLHIVKMAVAPNYRRRGAAQFMIHWSREFGKEHDCSRLFLRVRESNQMAINFYKKMGFEIIGEDIYPKSGETALTMELHLV